MNSYTYFVISHNISTGKWVVHKTAPQVILIASNIASEEEAVRIAREKAAHETRAEIMKVKPDGTIEKLTIPPGNNNK